MRTFCSREVHQVRAKRWRLSSYFIKSKNHSGKWLAAHWICLFSSKNNIQLLLFFLISESIQLFITVRLFTFSFSTIHQGQSQSSVWISDSETKVSRVDERKKHKTHFAFSSVALLMIPLTSEAIFSFSSSLARSLSRSVCQRSKSVLSEIRGIHWVFRSMPIFPLLHQGIDVIVTSNEQTWQKHRVVVSFSFCLSSCQWHLVLPSPTKKKKRSSDQILQSFLNIFDLR